MELLNFGQVESVNFSLDLNQEDKSGFSPLVLAVYGGHTDVVVALTKRCVTQCVVDDMCNFDVFFRGVDINKLCTSGATAFGVALITGWLVVMDAQCMFLKAPWPFSVCL